MAGSNNNIAPQFSATSTASTSSVKSVGRGLKKVVKAFFALDESKPMHVNPMFGATYRPAPSKGGASQHTKLM